MLYGFLVPHPDSAGVVGTCVVCYFVTVGVLSLYLTYFSGENLLLAKRVSSEVCSAPLTVYWLHIVILNHADTQGYAVHTFLSSWSVSYVPQQLTNKCLLVALFQHGTDTLRLMAGKHRYSFTYEVEILITRESTGEARISTATWFVWLEKAAQPRSTNLPPPPCPSYATIHEGKSMTFSTKMASCAQPMCLRLYRSYLATFSPYPTKRRIEFYFARPFFWFSLLRVLAGDMHALPSLGKLGCPIQGQPFGMLHLARAFDANARPAADILCSRAKIRTGHGEARLCCGGRRCNLGNIHRGSCRWRRAAIPALIGLGVRIRGSRAGNAGRHTDVAAA